MSKREAALKALEALRNTVYTQSIASDDDDAHFMDDDNYLDEFDEVDADEDSNERNIQGEEEMDDTNQHIIDSIGVLFLFFIKKIIFELITAKYVPDQLIIIKSKEKQDIFNCLSIWETKCRINLICFPKSHCEMNPMKGFWCNQKQFFKI
ncbi:hypothetical protein BpHYR1_003868 [Brachionus plicatilis]|uniref:Uncharacterized protein n=1 Tax=Brachionus plicatilis TaxID=10195 RepID=A0A3M7PGK0_BRAPC|nr:hypothetical protein BpHYR1_003868 [Brachionus plicatilis]